MSGSGNRACSSVRRHSTKRLVRERLDRLPVHGRVRMDCHAQGLRRLPQGRCHATGFSRVARPNDLTISVAPDSGLQVVGNFTLNRVVASRRLYVQEHDKCDPIDAS